MGICWRVCAEGVERGAHGDERQGSLIEVCGGEDEYGDPEPSLAHLKGVDAEYGWMRYFLSPEVVDSSSRAPLLVLSFCLKVVGAYECRAGTSGVVYFWYDGEEVVLCDAAECERRVIDAGAVSRAQVDVACQHERWDDAWRLALNIAHDGERHDALEHVRAERGARDASGFVRLLGTPRQRQWGARIREQALARLTAIQDEFFLLRSDTLVAEPREALLQRAFERLRTEPRATFWIHSRDALAHPLATDLIETLLMSDRPDLVDLKEAP